MVSGRGLSSVFLRERELDAVHLMRVSGAGVDREDPLAGEGREVGARTELGGGLVDDRVSPAGVPMPADHGFAARTDAVFPFLHTVRPSRAVPVAAPPVVPPRFRGARDPAVDQDIVPQFRVVDEVGKIPLQRRVLLDRLDAGTVIALVKLLVGEPRQRDDRFLGPVVQVAVQKTPSVNAVLDQIFVIPADQEFALRGQGIDESKALQRLLAPVKQVAETHENMVGVLSVVPLLVQRRDHLVVKRVYVGNDKKRFHFDPPVRRIDSSLYYTIFSGRLQPCRRAMRRKRDG